MFRRETGKAKCVLVVSLERYKIPPGLKKKKKKKRWTNWFIGGGVDQNGRLPVI